MRCVHWICAALAALAIPTAVMAQGTTTKQPVYHVKNEVTVRGKVVTVKAIPDWMGKDGVNIALESPDLTAPHIDVAPAAFLKLFDIPIAVGDDLVLTGSWSEAADGTPVFLVHELTKQKVTINVRDPQGVPLW
jgi:hypothetical protein